jgi:SOS-response transcriptional repressor LexA
MMFDQLIKLNAQSATNTTPARVARGQKRLAVLKFMREFFANNDQLPPCHVVAAHFGFRSENAAHEHMVALQKDGFLQKNSVGKWMFSRVPK